MTTIPEYGFFHPELGYWQSVGGVLDELMAKAPEGTVQVPIKPGADHEWDANSGEWVYAPPEPVDPLTLTLTKRQVNAALILAGHTDPDAFVEGAIDTIADPTQKALALNDWRFAPYFQRSHPLLNDEDVLAAASLTPEQVDGLWAVASTLPA